MVLVWVWDNFVNGTRMYCFSNSNSMWSGYFPGANVVATTSATETLNLILENGMNSEDIESDEMIGNSMKGFDNGFEIPSNKIIER